MKADQTLDCLRFLEMLNRILPVDFAKFKRITLKKTIPKLIELIDKLETAYKESSDTLRS